MTADPEQAWTAPHASGPVHAAVTVPGSKSMTNRALILAALAAARGAGTSTIGGALRSRDTDLMIGALATLGLGVDGDGTELTVSGPARPGPTLAPGARCPRRASPLMSCARGRSSRQTTAQSRPRLAPSSLSACRV